MLSTSSSLKKANVRKVLQISSTLQEENKKQDKAKIPETLSLNSTKLIERSNTLGMWTQML
jgi:hypothetical protein